MEKTFEYNPQLVCSRLFKITIDGDIVKKLEVVGGCQGNLRGISKLVEGMKIDDVIARLEGIECRGSRTGITSCPDQLAKALKSIK
ncbi:MAG: TIGR03905 family TSCPD domain-containing protein [Bacilli bacterium]|nr:TIGR03905 family TSCPD domain-containing protein [Erysipelotrichaceae bacterium]MDY4819731.1 TIGR03905 family TSCPD domain-containing protein [Bacilli bacterium]